MTNQPIDPRLTELLDWQSETGRPLPMPITEILTLEDAGCVVDLETGDVGHPCPRCGGSEYGLDIDGDMTCPDCLYIGGRK